MPPFSEPVCVCVRVCVYIREGELCKWPVCILLSVQGLQGDLRETSPLKLWQTDWRPHSVCGMFKSRPGRDKQIPFLFLDPTSLMFTHLHFYERALEVETTWLLSLSLVFTEAFALLFFRLSSVYNTVSQPSSTVGAVKTLFNSVSNTCLYFFWTETSIS